MSSQTNQHDPDESKRRQEEMQAQGAASQHASSLAAQDLDELSTSEFIETLFEDDVDSSFFNQLQDQLGPELSRLHALANEGPEEMRRHRWLNENRAEQILHEHNPGRLCKGPFLALAQGVNDAPDRAVSDELTQYEKRMIREAIQVKTAKQSLAQDAQGLRSFTEATAVSRVEHPDEGDSKNQSMFKKVFGR